MKFLLSFLVFIILNFAPKNNADDVMGEWLMPQKDGRVLIYKSNNKYFGKISWTNGAQKYDDKNPDKNKRKKELIGLVILQNFVFDKEDTWEDGKIYDPREGKTYSCTMSMPNKNQLKVRGYIGISLIGRTENWSRYK
jgi:uncharacterized protein (DUF2147 family)